MDHFCINCASLTTLTVHGHCSRCGSNAVDIAVRPPITALGLTSAFEDEFEIDMYDEEVEWRMLHGIE
jgi:hypothetical protein